MKTLFLAAAAAFALVSGAAKRAPRSSLELHNPAS
jgi:hypothetical protein